MSVDTELKFKPGMPPKPAKSSWIMPILLGIIFITVLSNSIKQIPQKEWLLIKVCKDQGPGNSIKNVSRIWEVCSQDVSVQTLAARWDVIFNIVNNVPALVVVPILGGLSDYVGRKPILAISVTMGIIDVASLVLVEKFQGQIWIIALMKLVTGFFGSWGVLVVSAYAIITDSSDAQSRTSRFVHLEGTVLLGFVLGPIIGGTLSKFLESGLLGVFQICLVLNIISLMLMALLEESLDSEVRQKRNEVSFSFFSIAKNSLKSAFSVFTHKQDFSRIPLLIVSFSLGIMMGANSTFFLWSAFVFGWNSYNQGIFKLVYATSRLLYMFIVFPLIKRFFTGGIAFDLGVLRFSVFILSLTTLLISLSTHGWMVLALAIVDGVGGLASSTTKGLLSSSSPAEMQGSLFSGIQVIQHLGYITSAITFPNVWAATVGSRVGSLFLYIQAGVFFFAFLSTLLLRVDRLRPVNEESQEPQMMEAQVMQRALTEVEIAAPLS